MLEGDNNILRDQYRTYKDVNKVRYAALYAVSRAEV